MKSPLCLVGQHAKQEVSRLQLGDGHFYSGWICAREGCQARQLTQGDKIPEFGMELPQIVRAVQNGIRAMRKEKDRGN